jgi:hypothetical protein
MATPETGLSYGDEDTPDFVTEGDEDIEVGDLSAVPDSDVMETQRNVLFDVRKATLDTQEYKLDSGEKRWAKRNLHLQLNVASDGVDGSGKYANKAFFTNLLLQVNKADFPEAFGDDRGYGAAGKKFKDTKQFYVAMGGDAKAISVTRAYRDELVGRQVKADIVKRGKRVNENGEWKDSGEFENLITNFKKAE